MTDSQNSHVVSYEGCNTTSRSLLDLARQDDDVAWQKVADLYTPMVKKWARSQNVPEATLSDLAQDVLFKVWKGLKSFDHNGQPGAFRAWLRTTTLRYIIDWWRAKKHHRYEQLSDELEQQLTAGYEVSPAQLEEEYRTLFERALEILARDYEEKTWQAFWQVVFEGGRVKDVAKRLGMTADAVSSAKYRVLRVLRVEMHELIE